MFLDRISPQLSLLIPNTFPSQLILCMLCASNHSNSSCVQWTCNIQRAAFCLTPLYSQLLHYFYPLTHDIH